MKPRVRIVGGPSATGTRILLDDEPIPGVQEIFVHAKVGELNRVTLHMIGVGLDVKADAKVKRRRRLWRR